jgi:hypothetical protein
MSGPGISQGQILAAIAGAALVATLFLSWLGTDVPEVTIPEGAPPEVTEAAEETEDAATTEGWDVKPMNVYVLIVAALVLGGVGMKMGGRPEGLPFAPAAAAFLLGLIGLIMTAYLILDKPEGTDLEIGIILAAVAFLGVSIGSYLQMQEEYAEY